MAERFVLLELVGGPRDGDVLGWQFPPAQTIVFPILARTMFRPTPPLEAVPPLRRGHYRRRVKQPGFDVITLDVPVKALRSDGRELVAFLKGRDARPLVYHWEGEDDY